MMCLADETDQHWASMVWISVMVNQCMLLIRLPEAVQPKTKQSVNRRWFRNSYLQILRVDIRHSRYHKRFRIKEIYCIFQTPISKYWWKLGSDAMLIASQIRGRYCLFLPMPGFNGNLVAQGLQWNPNCSTESFQWWLQPLQRTTHWFGATTINPLNLLWVNLEKRNHNYFGQHFLLEHHR